MRIIQGIIARMLLALSVVLLGYFVFVYGLQSIMFFPIILLVLSLVFRVYINKKLHKDEELDEAEGKSILTYYIVALFGLVLGSLVVKGLYNFPYEKYLTDTPIMSAFLLDPSSQWVFTTVMAITEEWFFRGELLEFLTYRLPPGLASFVSALVFMSYHLGVYGTSFENLMYILVGGIGLAIAVTRSRRLEPSLFAHITNNLMAVFLG
jgi:membrane protease YdiL (CAAX protease family)